MLCQSKHREEDVSACLFRTLGLHYIFIEGIKSHLATYYAELFNDKACQKQVQTIQEYYQFNFISETDRILEFLIIYSTANKIVRLSRETVCQSVRNKDG